jgi:hypothetical protein
MMRVNGVRLPWLDIVIIVVMGLLLGWAIGLWLNAGLR